jgi:hypothetical protein
LAQRRLRERRSEKREGGRREEIQGGRRVWERGIGVDGFSIGVEEGEKMKRVRVLGERKKKRDKEGERMSVIR